MSEGQGLFITFEGGEGAGKSTQIRRLAERMRKRGLKVITTREPGGSPGAEALRHVLLSGAAEPFGPRMEAILFAAARNDHVEGVIRPGLEAGSVVLCDRFMDSARVYQGVTGNLSPSFIDALERIAIDGVRPHLTLVFDIPADIGMARARRRAGVVASGRGGEADRFEREQIEVHEMRRRGFLDIAAGEPERCRVIDASADEETVADAVLAAVRPLAATLRDETRRPTVVAE